MYISEIYYYSPEVIMDILDEIEADKREIYFGTTPEIEANLDRVPF